MDIAAAENNICPFCGGPSKIMFKVDKRVFFACQNKECGAMFERPEPQIPYEYDQSLSCMTKQYESILGRIMTLKTTGGLNQKAGNCCPCTEKCPKNEKER